MNNFVGSDLKKYFIAFFLVLAVITYLFVEFAFKRTSEPAPYQTSSEEVKKPVVVREHDTPGSAEEIQSPKKQLPIYVQIGLGEYNLDLISYTIDPTIEIKAELKTPNDTTFLQFTPTTDDWKRDQLYKITVNTSTEIFDYYFKITEPADMKMGY